MNDREIIQIKKLKRIRAVLIVLAIAFGLMYFLYAIVLKPVPTN